MVKNSLSRYDNLSKAFHWVTAAIVLATFTLGPGDFGHVVDSGIDPGSRVDIVWHETLGASVFLITFFRLIWNAVRSGAPEHQMAPGLRLVSRLMHIMLWGLLFALPVSAFMALGSEINPLTLLGGLRMDEIPWIASSPLSGVADWGEVHKFLGDAVVWLAALHAVGAIYHHFKLKDKVLTSMLP
jgi:cytochrome b561